MPALKPKRAILLNKSHPLARSLIGCWLMNEGSGNKVFDLSGHGYDGTFTGTAPSWNSGKFGHAVNLPGSDEYVNVGTGFPSLVNAGTISVWFNTTVLTPSPEGVIVGATKSASERIEIAVGDQSTFSVIYYNGSFFGASESSSLGWHHIVLVMNNGAITGYLNGILMDDTLDTKSMSSTDNFAIGAAVGANPDYFNGKVDHAMVWKRALSDSEVARLYREPFCIFDVSTKLGLLYPVGQIVWLTAVSTATASVHGSLTRQRKLAGIVRSAVTLSGILKLRYRGQVERQWLIDALFNGMTSNAFKLGTVITGGWFWMRRAGCCALYRGPSMEQIDFANILAVAEQEADSISPPSYIPHHSSSIYFYVVRRFNNCGYQERTLAAAVKVSIDTQGNLSKPQPNNIFTWRVDQVDGNKTELTWFYCPLEQKSRPARFKIYYDGGTGLIDYQNPIATINYQGRKFYTYQSDALPAGRYLFAVRAEDADSIENNSLAQLQIQLNITNPDVIEVLSVETL